MTTAATKGFGTLLKLGDGGGSETFTTIAEVRDISGPNLSMGTADVTSHSSTGGWDEGIGTILSGGEVTFGLNFLPANATQSYSAGLIKDFTNRTLRNFQMVFTNSGSTTWTFAALVTRFQPTAPVTGHLTANVTLRISGQPTLA